MLCRRFLLLWGFTINWFELLMGGNWLTLFCFVYTRRWTQPFWSLNMWYSIWYACSWMCFYGRWCGVLLIAYVRLSPSSLFFLLPFVTVLRLYPECSSCFSRIVVISSLPSRCGTNASLKMSSFVLVCRGHIDVLCGYTVAAYINIFAIFEDSNIFMALKIWKFENLTKLVGKIKKKKI